MLFGREEKNENITDTLKFLRLDFFCLKTMALRVRKTHKIAIGQESLKKECVITFYRN